MDLTACSNKHCPIRATCYRYIGQMDSYQSMAMFNKHNDEECKDYINIFDCFDIGKRNKNKFLERCQQISDKRDQNVCESMEEQV